VAVHNVPGVDHHQLFALDPHVRAVAQAMNLHLGGAPAREMAGGKRRRPCTGNGSGAQGYPRSIRRGSSSCSSCAGKNIRDTVYFGAFGAALALAEKFTLTISARYPWGCGS
jgi:hypothetical protein